MNVRIRRATVDDVDFLLELANHEDGEPFMSVRRARDRETMLAEIERSEREPLQSGRFVIEARDGSEWKRAGALGFDVANQRSKIANLGGLATHPDFRGHRIADEAARQLQRHLLYDLGFHRLQLECYGFNVRAIRHAERAGFVREGTKRKAYLRHGEWVDGIMFGLLKEDLEAQESERS